MQKIRSRSRRTAPLVSWLTIWPCTRPRCGRQRPPGMQKLRSRSRCGHFVGVQMLVGSCGLAARPGLGNVLQWSSCRIHHHVYLVESHRNLGRYPPHFLVSFRLPSYWYHQLSALLVPPIAAIPRGCNVFGCSMEFGELAVTSTIRAQYSCSST